MVKKIFKLLLKGIIGIILLIAIAYFSFLGWEYITGGKYVKYLNEHKETVALTEDFSYYMMEEDLKNHQFILVGESHGFKEPCKFDVHFFKHLYNNFGVRTYITEFDFSQASLINAFMESGDENFLHQALKKWIVIQGRNNKDYINKFKAFYSFYQQLPPDDKFKFVGIDKIQDLEILTDHVNVLSEMDTTLESITYTKKLSITELKNRINQLLSSNDLTEPMRIELTHLSNNIGQVEGKVGREKVMFQNFAELYKYHNWSKQKLYGFFGLYHVFQYRVNGQHPLAAQIRQSELGLEGKILSMNFLFVDSKMVTASRSLPEFMRDEGKYTKMNITTDNLLFMYIYGIRDFKRTTGEHQKSIIKMHGEQNPYANSSRLNISYQILPVTDLWEMSDKGKPYTQYSIFVRNSDWAEPMME